MKESNENYEFLEIVICSLAFSFRQPQAHVFFRHTVVPLFSLRKNKIENADYASDTKTEIKVFYPWCGIIYFFGP